MKFIGKGGSDFPELKTHHSKLKTDFAPTDVTIQPCNDSLPPVLKILV